MKFCNSKKGGRQNNFEKCWKCVGGGLSEHLILFDFLFILLNNFVCACVSVSVIADCHQINGEDILLRCMLYANV